MRWIARGPRPRSAGAAWLGASISSDGTVPSVARDRPRKVATPPRSWIWASTVSDLRLSAPRSTPPMLTALLPVRLSGRAAGRRRRHARGIRSSRRSTRSTRGAEVDRGRQRQAPRSGAVHRCTVVSPTASAPAGSDPTRARQGHRRGRRRRHARRESAASTTTDVSGDVNGRRLLDPGEVPSVPVGDVRRPRRINVNTAIVSGYRCLRPDGDGSGPWRCDPR